MSVRLPEPHRIGPHGVPFDGRFEAFIDGNMSAEYSGDDSNAGSLVMDDVYLESVRRRHQRQQNRAAGGITTARRRNGRTAADGAPQTKIAAFMNQEVDPDGWGLIPEGYETITYITLFIFAPWLTGMAFFFFYVSNARPSLYAQIHTGGPLLDWMVGYEILASIALLIIAKKFFSFLFSS